MDGGAAIEAHEVVAAVATDGIGAAPARGVDIEVAVPGVRQAGLLVVVMAQQPEWAAHRPAAPALAHLVGLLRQQLAPGGVATRPRNGARIVDQLLDDAHLIGDAGEHLAALGLQQRDGGVRVVNEGPPPFPFDALGA